MSKKLNQSSTLFLSVFMFLIMGSLRTPLQAQTDAAYEDEYAAILARMVEKGKKTDDAEFLGPVEYWQDLWDRVEGTDTWEQMKENVHLITKNTTEYDGSTGTTFALLTRSNRVAWLAFPGVNEDINPSNLETGAKGGFIAYPENATNTEKDVHQYFYAEWKILQGEINSWLTNNKDNFDKLILTGHSKGAVLSQYFLADYADNLADKSIHFIAFGSPNGGNEAFIQYWANKSNLNRAHFYTTYGAFSELLWDGNVDDLITWNEVSSASIISDGFVYHPRGLSRSTDKYLTDMADNLIRQKIEVAGGSASLLQGGGLFYDAKGDYAHKIHDDSYYLSGLQTAFNNHELETIRPSDISTPAVNIRQASNTSKCLDNYAYHTVNGNNIQVYTCKSNNAAAQTWSFQGNQIKLASNPNYCLDVENANANTGANVQLYTCRWEWDQLDKAQQWVYDGRIRSFRYMDNPNYCLSVSGTNVQLSTCSEGNSSQQWEIEGTFTSDIATTGKTSIIKLAADTDLCIYSEEGRTKNYSPFTIQSYDASIDQGLIFNTDGSISFAKRTDRCLDLAGGKTDNNTALEVVPCTGYDSQKWFYDGFNKALRSGSDYRKCLQGGDNGDPLLISTCTNSKSQQFVIGQNLKIHLAKDDNKCMDLAGTLDADHDHANIQVYDCKSNTDSKSQYFLFDGTRIIMQDYPGYCLDLENGNTANGTNIHFYTCNGSDAQKWVYDEANTGAIKPISNSNKCIRIKDGSTANENNIELWDCTGAIAQKFVIK